MSWQVDVDALQQLGGEFEAASGNLAAHVRGFSGQAHLSGDAFGLLPAGLAARSDYQRKLQEALDSLALLQAALSQMSVNLAIAAGNYEASDQASSGL
jgi:hypothetical protein